MSDLVDIHDLEQVRAIGVQIQAKSEAFGTTAEGLISDIEAGEAGYPFGHDETGDTLYKSYQGKGDTGDEGKGDAPAQARDGMRDHAQSTARLGGGLTGAMNDYQGADLVNEKDINSVPHKPA